ncbi:barstar family protein [Actinokineospora guangxiensis]|uniref:Barstar family protein n=1 Tax=Actinokineospora guangxiensis TaxID=1490288 RepID=A0ABW0EKZ7_9PSEU
MTGAPMIDHAMDGTRVRTKPDFYEAVAEVMSFPDWFGHNLDALYDCLTDLSWLPPGKHVLVWFRPDVLADADPAGYRAVQGVLADAVADFTDPERGFSVVLIEP